MKLLYMNPPTPDPSQEGSKCSSPSCQFPSWEGLGVGSGSQCTASKSCGLSMNPRVMPASCRQRNLREALPTRRRQHLIGGTIRHLRGSLVRTTLLSVSLALSLSFSAFGKEVEEKQTLRKTFAFDESAGAKAGEVDNFEGAIQVTGHGGREGVLVVNETLEAGSQGKGREAR